MRYELMQADICWFAKSDGGYYIRFFPQEPIYCAVDKKTGLAVDLSTYLRYPYYEYNASMFSRYMDQGYLNENTRLVTFGRTITEANRSIVSKFRYVCKLIEKGEEFPNGSDVISTEEYRQTKLSPETVSKIDKLQKKYGKKF